MLFSATLDILCKFGWLHRIECFSFFSIILRFTIYALAFNEFYVTCMELVLLLLCGWCFSLFCQRPYYLEHISNVCERSTNGATVPRTLLSFSTLIALPLSLRKRDTTVKVRRTVFVWNLLNILNSKLNKFFGESKLYIWHMISTFWDLILFFFFFL